MSAASTAAGTRRLGGRTLWALALLLAGLTSIAWANRFVQDDAFISFRYAWNLVHGHGLVWNPGEPLEGYTNLLWTLLAAGAIGAGLDPVAFSLGLGLAAFAATLWLVWRLAASLFGSNERALAAVLLLGANHSFSAYATGGLETSLQAALLTAALLLALEGPVEARVRPWRLAALSLVLAAAVLTHPDSVVLAVVLVPFAAWVVLRARAGAVRGRALAALVVPLVAVLGAWAAWKLAYYGELLPNTYYAKVDPSGAARLETLRVGTLYVGTFYFYYALFPFPVIALVRIRETLRRLRPEVALLAVFVVLWTCYVAVVGGDFMEYRILMPVLPAVIVLCTWVLFELVPGRGLRAAFVLVVLAASVLHGQRRNLPLGMESVRQLAGHLEHDAQDWDGVGRLLGEAFAYDTTVTIATTAAGAIPYYSCLRTIDQHGLNDAWVARYGHPHGPRAGHRRRATLAYLLERRVNLVVSPHNVVARVDSAEHEFILAYLRSFRFGEPDPELLSPETRLVAIPIGPEYALIALYLRPHPTVDAAIQRLGWRKYPIRGFGA